MKYLIKNFGLTALGLCLLTASVEVSTALGKYNKTIAQNTSTISEFNACKAGLGDLMKTANLKK